MEDRKDTDGTERCSVRGRVMEIVQRVYTDDGEARVRGIVDYAPMYSDYRITPEKVEAVCKRKKQIKRYAFTVHDKDIYYKDDVDALEGQARAGELRPIHYHVVLDFGKKAVELSYVAKWFGVPENFVRMKKGQGAFIESVQYLTHEDRKGCMVWEHRKGLTIFVRSCL